MATQDKTASFSLTLFNVYKRTEQQQAPTFLYTNRKGEARRIPFLQPEEENSKAVKSALHRLQPLARRIFSSDRQIFTTVPKELHDELRSSWQLGKDQLKIQFTRSGGICLEEDYLLLYLEVQPHLPSIDMEHLPKISVMMCNRLSYAGRLHGLKQKTNIPKNSLLTRAFHDNNAEQISQRHFGENNKDPLLRGILGETITVEDIFASIAGPGWESMLGDRLLLNSLLITPTKEQIPKFKQEEVDNLVRRSRGMHSLYLPPASEDLVDHVIPVQTFRNVLFMTANEGIAGHVKPDSNQEFLRNQFSARYRTEYMLLFLLAVYQHYRLAAMLQKCVQGIEEQSSQGHLRQLRKELVLHELKYINTQPAFLTNYQQYYTGLRQGLHTEALVNKLRRTLTELDILLAEEEQQAAEVEQKAKKADKERDEKGKKWLAVLVEAIALPYYFYNLVKYALYDFLHLKNGLLTWGITIPVTLGIIYGTLRAMRRKKGQ